MYRCQECKIMLKEFDGYCPNCFSVRVKDFSSSPVVAMARKRPPTKKTPCESYGSGAGCGGSCVCKDQFRCARCGGRWNDKTAKSCGLCGHTVRENIPCNCDKCKKDSDCDSGGCGGGGCGGCDH